ncbi:MAG: sigma-70 family RNA polymerase sigma factor [Synergistales bacterium]|nr:sigma-70 family RNA polymerase sigma factor [Synergistales bacterium]MDY6402255.1 sigma-70 family RNA polymerase sigma factor [Synergistales bacterium]MDY6404966.1 sigma-70 family RNA polymerase sigma factor [Synergistales bacterium]MDY6410337.1 sigma-70 family RNA polymerase sigma factor [Synergistales bacterium]MDY6414315.1 sigma-70 family RNA polymerase sigma factor [Synergistales bacterium]
MSLEPEREKNLWRLCSQGDMEAREELIVAYRPLVFWIAGKIHISDTELKQDIIQEGMLALINAVDKFEPEREFKFSTYAYHKIHGQIINMLERGEKRAPLPVPDEWLQIAEDNDKDEESGEEWLDVAQSISKLEGREAEIVSALFFEGKKPKEVAAEKKLDVSHVYRLRRAAIAKIRGWLGLEGAF